MRQVAFAIEAGVDVIQIREHDLDARPLGVLAAAIVKLTRSSRTRVVVNDRLDVALAVGADGVHLPAHSLSVRAARRLAPAGFLIGRSVHDQEELEAASGADYLVAGTVWPTVSKGTDRRCLGIAGLSILVRAAGAPVLAIGGVTEERLPEVAAAGAVGVAAVGLFLNECAGDICHATPLVNVVHSVRVRFDTSRPGS